MTFGVCPRKTVANVEAQTRQVKSMRFKIISRQVLASVSLCLICLSHGMAFAFTGTLLPRIRDFINKDDGTWLAATNIFSMVVGAFVSLYIIPLLGYRSSLINSEILCVIGWLTLSFSEHFIIFILGSILVGFSSGFDYQILTISRGEILASEIRGILSSVITSSYMLGVLLVHLSAIILPWRIALKCCSLAPLLTAVASIFVYPESPSWLLYKERTEEAGNVFFSLREVTAESQEEFKFMQAKQSILRERGVLGSFKAICTKDFVVPFLIGFTLLTAQCVSGCDIIAIYSVDLLSKMSYMSPDVATIFFDGLSIAACIVSSYMTKKITHRGLLFFSSVGTIVLLILLMVISVHQFSAAVFALCLCAYSAIVNVGLVPISWLLISEIFPEPNKDIAICLANGYFNFFIFILAKLVPIIESSGGIVAALGFFGITFSLSIIVLFFIMPETKELSLSEIEDVVRQGKLYRFASYLTKGTAGHKS